MAVGKTGGRVHDDAIMRDIFAAAGIHACGISADVNHDWCWWHKQPRYFLPHARREQPSACCARLNGRNANEKAIPHNRSHLISPQFPKHYWNFLRPPLRTKNGVTVLGIGDSPYDAPPMSLANALTEYYYPPYPMTTAMVKAVGFFTFKYGKIDWIESNNELWLAYVMRAPAHGLSRHEGRAATTVTDFIKNTGHEGILRWQR